MHRLPAVAAAALVAVALLAGRASAAADNAYTVTNLVSDGAVPAALTDTSLKNGWGITAGPTTPWWVSDNGTNESTLYTGTGAKVFPAGHAFVNVQNDPTGTVFNGGSGFVASEGARSGPARFIFAGEAGSILGWNPSVDSATAVVGIDRSGDGAVYKGLAIVGGNLYATDFHNARVDEIDSSWHVATAPGAFIDRSIPAGYAPFGIQAIGGDLFVTYAKQDDPANAHDEVDGQSLGFVDEYDANGALLARIAQRGQLNAPWGLAMAPASFGAFGGDLLVGNFGDGTINAYAPTANGRFEHRGQLRNADSSPVTIDGLWGIGFGNGAAAGPANILYFAAGTNGEADGLFGSISANG
jgi:uncharacterized protein (TIGR03118 family)